MKLKHYILLLSFLFSLPALNAQKYHISQGVSYHYLHNSNNNNGENNEFDLGYQISFEYNYKSRRGFKMKVLAGIYHINSGYNYESTSFYNSFHRSVHVNTHYFVIGWRPLNFKLLNKNLEMGMGFDLYSRLKDNSTIRESYSFSGGYGYYPGPGSTNQDRFLNDAVLSGNFSISIDLSYIIAMPNQMALVPRITYRRVKLLQVDTDVSNVFGAEVGLSF